MRDVPIHSADADQPLGLDVAPAPRASPGGVRTAAVVSRRPVLSPDDLARGVARGDRATLARAISLIESANPRHADDAQRVLAACLPSTGHALRVGITGVPGVGKSTFVETLGTTLTGKGHRVAVLAVDPSSGVSGGSVLGDKTRMPRLANDPNAFIRPSPAAGTLGGVARRTRETMLLCEAAGFDIVLVETVGVGQSETTVSGMTDLFLALMLPGAGDELQGIKRGLLELVDVIAINKADGDNVQRASLAKAEYEAACRVMRPHADGWVAPVMLCSAKTGQGVEDLWRTIDERLAAMRTAGTLEARRQTQALAWVRSMVTEGISALLEGDTTVARQRHAIEQRVLDGSITPSEGATRVLGALRTALASEARNRPEGNQT